jgi:AcrR family transcriptional regulator
VTAGDDSPQRTLGAKGARTRARILEAAEEVLGRRGFHDASIAEITQLAGVAQGSFYIYFPSKLAIFEELMAVRGDEMTEEIRRATEGLTARADIEREGFRAFFRWIAEHRWLYRVSRQAEFVDPALRERWYRSFAGWYSAALKRAAARGEIEPCDPDVLAWSVMGMADFTAMRWIVWDEASELSEEQLAAFVGYALRALGVRD